MPLMTNPATGLQANGGSQFAAKADEHRHFDALRRMFALFPAALTALDNQYDLIIGQGTLDRSCRELIFACAASARGDLYLAEAMANQAALHGLGDPETALAIASTANGRSDAESRLLAWVQKMATTPYKSVEADAEQLHAAGWSDQEIVEALTVVSLSAYMSTMSLTLKLA